MLAPLRPVERRRRVWLVATIALLLVSIAAAQDDPPDSEAPEGRVEHGDVVRIFSGDAEVPRGVVRHGSLVVIGGQARIDGELRGDAVVILGSLHATGEVRGQVVGVLADLSLDGARVHDQVVSVLGQLERQDLIAGDRVVHIGLPGMRVPGLLTLLSWARLVGLLLVFVLLVLLTALVPERVRAIGEEAPVRYVQAFFVGLLGYIAAWAVMILVSVTLVGAPLAYVAFLAAKWLGVAGLFYAIGRAIPGARGSLSPFAAVLLVFGIYAAALIALGAAGFKGLLVIIVLRLLFLCLFEIPGIGLVLLTRAGTRGAAGAVPPSPVPGVPQAPAPIESRP